MLSTTTKNLVFLSLFFFSFSPLFFQSSPPPNSFILGHPIAFEVNTELFFCFECDRELGDEEDKREEEKGKRKEKGEEGEVHTLREIKKSIHEISSQHQDEEEEKEKEEEKGNEEEGERKRRKKKGVEPKKYGDYEEEDLKFTAVAHWRFAVLSQVCTKKWKIENGKWKMENGKMENGKYLYLPFHRRGISGNICCL